MWLIGTIVVLAVGAAATIAVGWRPRARPSPPLWDIPKLGGGTAGNAGAFAGFSLTAAIFVAGVGGAQSAPAFVTVFGMLLIGFLILVVATWINSSIPDHAKVETAITPALLYVLGNIATNLGVAVTWLALPPLLAVVGLPSLVGVFLAWLLIMVLVAGAWAALLVYRLTAAGARACLLIPGLSLALPALYRLAVVPRWPALWPAGSRPAMRLRRARRGHRPVRPPSRPPPRPRQRAGPAPAGVRRASAGAGRQPGLRHRGGLALVRHRRAVAPRGGGAIAGVGMRPAGSPLRGRR